ncbi:hypothetical protein COS81_01975 [candidate division WWE3 bacterium CG06_land_8_20_14_3_00_42_16]|uniref:SipW-cognate class signal peptide n=2 Tax=Katanobacteria TaxID=422282 RepID=A0A2M7ANL1_UNCKA|nr:MAG: hypothetical protein AUJ38_00390 [bacterium CG1_02_42_9]PIU68962.1 MAG: hypothetical protein COS81_01975 [candidate division WWE3 bacterium CG06_land_8_20_14_3_00_42_16]PJA38308.1 MAG: hypothetical protein CO181_00685 [candidate division WWE3 bacterium CG_4_9_14_3_um_filter_43_9]
MPRLAGDGVDFGQYVTLKRYILCGKGVKKMKKIILSLGTLCVITGIAIGVTAAYFNSHRQILGNAATAGKLNIDWNGSVASSVNLTAMEPGVWYGANGEYTLFPTNDADESNLAAKYKFTESLVEESESGMYADYVNVKVAKKEDAEWISCFEGKLKGMDVNPSLCAAMGNLEVGETHDWRFEFRLDPETSNQYQGASVSFNLNLLATQKTNPSW